MREVFAILAKRPLAGFSKTRLSSCLGEKNTVCLYESFMEDFFTRLKREWKGPVCFFGTPQNDDTFQYFEQFFSRIQMNVDFAFQKELPFFERLKWIFDEIKRKKKDVFIHLTGSDIPDFPFEFLSQVKPGKTDVFLGPDADKGYYYVGASCRYGNIFEGTGKNPLDTILNQCKRLNLTVKTLPEWSDIDSFSDLKKSLKRSESQMPATHACFKRLKPT